MLKAEARKLFREKRALISTSQKMMWDDLLLIQFQKANLPFFNAVLSYYPLEEKKEIDTFLITDYLHFVNPSLVVCYPKINSEEDNFTAVVATDNDSFLPNKYGIPEPVNTEAIDPLLLDAVLVPLLCFDERGYRAGYGKGFYDRFLKDCKSSCIKIGLSYFEPVERLDDAADYDVPLDICITPQKAYVF